MSVINRMLKDLDQRQQQPRKQGAAPAAASPSAFPWGRVLGGVGVSALVVIAIVLVYQSDFMAAPDQEAVTSQQTVKVSEPLPQPTAAPATQVATEQVPSPVAVQPQQKLAPQPVAPSTEPKPKPEPTPEPKPEPTPEATPAAGSTEPANNSGSMEVTAVQLSAEELAEVKLKQAREAMQKGERERAGSLFEQVIALAPKHIDARSELAAYWYGRGRVNAAVAVLQEGLQQIPQQQRWLALYSRILLENAAYTEILTVLATIPAQTPETVDLLQVRATAANELGRYAQAGADYQQLAKLTQQGRWWLAAAVAFEDAQQPDAARMSYQRALQDPNLSAEARNYATQRHDALGGQ